MAAADSIINSNFSEMQWINTMQRSLDGDTSQEIDLHCCIFRVSKSIRDLKPESYTPQRIAIGPYHHFRPGPYMAHKFKLKQVKSLLSKFNIPKFKSLVILLKKKARDITAFYSGDLNIRHDTLSWMMVIDGLFLLKLMDDEELPFTSGLMDSYGRKFPVDCVRTDAVMIENQIPFFVLEYLNEVLGSGSLLLTAMELCRRVSPVDSSLEGSTRLMTEQPLHLLHLLYKFVCFELEDSPLIHGRVISRWRSIKDRIIAGESTTSITTTTPPDFNFVVIPKKVVVLVTNILQLLGFSKSSQNTEEKPLIPSASQLSSVSVKLVASKTSEGIRSTQFRREDVTLVLPALTLNTYSDSVIRNLLAFEAITMADTPKFARYIEIMSALIKTTKDVDILKNENIIRHDGENEDVVKVIKDCITYWTRGKTVLDGVVYQVNEHYNRMWKTKSKRLITKLSGATMKYLVVLVVVVFYLLVFLDIYYSASGSAGRLLARLRELDLPSF